ncbi:hypothetical protein NHX12_034483 [Muraenolepis orangiensis]|uniref:Uncharacterized protein n=1 Tax=Muraenolepis orangiensis TaxID=630683 RepID=A0A9Q0D8N9_9TELE|nr:hypothetical protein NHX12_034483 [Muraenolepis orangiensis]
MQVPFSPSQTKSNVLMELRRWRVALNEQHEQHQLELMRLRMALNEQREQHQQELMRLRMAPNEQRQLELMG